MNASMRASRTRATLPLLSLCAVALLLSPASAAAAGRWPADSPAEAPTPVAGAPDGAQAAGGGDLAGADGVAAPPGRLGFRPHPALSPEARRGLEHEARCGPRVPVPRARGVPWPGWKPRCGGGGGGGDDTHGGAAAGAPGARLPPLYDEP
ncbi:hypothetical protein ACP4OV_004133 [Aristida adscensionis]